VVARGYGNHFTVRVVKYLFGLKIMMGLNFPKIEACLLNGCEPLMEKPTSSNLKITVILSKSLA
jgi:hypothetical protein